MTTTIFRSLLSLLFVCAASPALADKMSCYPADIPAPRSTLQTILVIDRTAPLDANAVRDFIAAGKVAAGRFGQRLVVLSFAGLAPGENLNNVLDLKIEAPIEDPQVRANARIGPFKSSQRCVQKRQQQALEKLTATLTEQLRPPSKALQRSEIVYALRRTLESFAAAELSTLMLVYSDGVQNGSGLVFYDKSGHPRRIDAKVELRKLKQTGQSAPPREALGPTKVLWWGLLVPEPAPVGTPPRYYSADWLEQYSTFWRAVLTGWGVPAIAIGEPSLLNPDLAHPALKTQLAHHR